MTLIEVGTSILTCFRGVLGALLFISRMQFKEEVREQKRIMVFVYIMWLVAFVPVSITDSVGRTRRCG